MRTKSALAIAAIALLSACAGNGNPGGTSALPFQSAPAAPSAAHAAPATADAADGTFLDTLAADSNAPRTGGIPVRSATWHYVKNGYIHNVGFNGTCSIRVKPGGQTVGCILFSSVTGFIQQSRIDFYTKSFAHGCLVSTGTYRGQVVKGNRIPAIYHYVHNNCYG